MQSVELATTDVRRPLPPGPRGAEAWRTLLSFSHAPIVGFPALFAQYGDVLAIPVVGQTVVLVGDPTMIGEILLDKEGVFHKDFVTASLSEFLGQGLLTSEDDLWKRQRKLIAPSLTKKQVSSYADAMVRRTLEWIDGRAEDEVRDVHDDMQRLTLEIVVETLFGSELPRGAAHRIGGEMEAIMQSFQTLVQTWRRVFPMWWPFDARLRMRRAARELDLIVTQIIAKRRAEAAAGTAGDDLLSRLIAARAEDGSAMGDAQLRDEAVTFVLAGHETTANALSFVLYLLADHPEVVQKLRDEATRVLGDRAPKMEDVPRLTYADAVFKETMRLYPPAYAFGRKPTRDVVIGGHRVPKGAQIIMSPWALQRDARFYPEPERFRPERWLDGAADRIPKNVYLPFGGGPRICVGNHFAMMEGALVTTLLARALDVAHTDETFLDLRTSITLRPDRLRLRVRRAR